MLGFHHSLLSPSPCGCLPYLAQAHLPYFMQTSSLPCSDSARTSPFPPCRSPTQSNTPLWAPLSCLFVPVRLWHSTVSCPPDGQPSLISFGIWHPMWPILPCNLSHPAWVLMSCACLPSMGVSPYPFMLWHPLLGCLPHIGTLFTLLILCSLHMNAFTHPAPTPMSLLCPRPTQICLPRSACLNGFCIKLFYWKEGRGGERKNQYFCEGNNVIQFMFDRNRSSSALVVDIWRIWQSGDLLLEFIIDWDYWYK